MITERDGHAANAGDIFLTAGASSGVSTLLHTLCASKSTGVLIPIPQYPLYTATLALVDVTPVPYYLDEPLSWATDVPAIRKEIIKAKATGTELRSIVVINPGNPTGATLTEQNISDVITLAAEENLVIMADEVYQTNVYQGEFHSFKKVLRNLQKESPKKYEHVELVSFHSVSKGMVGECGHRGGYFELVGFDAEVQSQIYKLVSITLCPPVIGQCLVELMVNPPKKGSESYVLYDKEYNSKRLFPFLNHNFSHINPLLPIRYLPRSQAAFSGTPQNIQQDERRFMPRPSWRHVPLPNYHPPSEGR